jgi:sulfonate transport system substrate-binding protein
MLAACGGGSSSGDGGSLTLDYAYYNPLSLVVKDQRCVEDALAERGTSVEWVFSAGSNKANENLNAGVIDIGSTAGAAALAARANGADIKTIATFSQPEWAAVVVPADSSITSIADLKGARIAATKGTDPYFFLLQALNEAGLSESDIEIINLQHSDGQAALARGDVEAWAGLDPIMAQAEANDGVRLIYRNIDFNSYGVLNARENFITQSPDTIEVVLSCYQKARAWILANPDQAVDILAAEASLDPDVARIVLTERTVIDLSLTPTAAQRAVLDAIWPILVAEGQVRSEADVIAALETLYAVDIANKVNAQ